MSTGWHPIGHLDDIPPLGARCVQTPAGRIAVFRTADDRVFALDDRCPHKGGPLSQGIVHDTSVTCPLHNAVVALESGTLRGPDQGRTATYAVRVDPVSRALELCLSALDRPAEAGQPEMAEAAAV